VNSEGSLSAGEQRTLAHSFTFAGVGIHTGAQSRVTVHPADVDTGRMIRAGTQTFPVRADLVVDTTRCTALAYEGARVLTIEHLLSALFAYQVDNVLIEVEGGEIPILDGSALPHVQAIEQSGIIAQGKPARVLILEQPLVVQERGSELRAEPASTFQVEARVEFSQWPEGNMALTFVSDSNGPKSYAKNIAPARTFAFRQEVEMLLAAGLARGGSLDNALIITPPDEFSSPLRLPGEWCAHKLLDVLGDLALVNSRLQLSVTALRPGHTVNVFLARALLEQSL
jgi:UDP-3-O-[3-hydroxymyristoyl] N-acetylglucosamine deacetylase